MAQGDAKLPEVKVEGPKKLMRNQTEVWKTKTGRLQGDKAWSRDPKFTV